jgi:epoxyqueuosine reductase
VTAVALEPGARELQHEAEQRGFLVSWAPVELPATVRIRYEEWLEQRRHATMGELARALDVRFEPAQRFGWARSVMVLAAPHGYPDPGSPEDGVRIGRVGRVFWVREQGWLERLVQPHLEALKARCRELGARCRDYVDQGPLPVRSHAAQTGLGWIGRNGMVMRPRHGSYLTLAVLLTSFDVEPAEPHRQLCGSCRLCVQACPVGALLGDGTLDANRCISYWTTQHPGLVPADLWPGFGDWLFGCDTCQTVCPWNARAASFWDGYGPEPVLAHPDLRSFFSASGDGFAERYRGSSFERAGRWRLARNALIVLANDRSAEHVPLARLGARDTDPLVRATAAVALAALGDTAAAAALRDDPDERVRVEAERALQRFSGV